MHFGGEIWITDPKARRRFSETSFAENNADLRFDLHLDLSFDKLCITRPTTHLTLGWSIILDLPSEARPQRF